MRKFDTLIWDLDGTLLNTLEDLCSAVNYTLRHYGMPERTLEEVRQFVGNGARRLIALSVTEDTKDEEVDGICDFFRDYYAKNCDIKTAPYDGVLPLLEKLNAEGFKMAIVSNKPDKATKILSAQYFGGLISSAVGENEACGIRKKPCPDAVFAAIEELGADKEKCAYIGDSEVDVLTAKNSGLPCISVTWGFRTRKELEENGADVFAANADELEKILIEYPPAVKGGTCLSLWESQEANLFT